MRKKMNSAPKWRQHGSKNQDKVYQKRGPEIDAKKGPHARTRLAGRRYVAGTLLRLIISSRLVFRLVFRLVLASFHVSGSLETSREVIFPVRHPFSFHVYVFGRVLTSCIIVCLVRIVYPVKVCP